MFVEDKEIKVFSEKDPKNLPWENLQVDVVLECTGRFTSKTASIANIEAGAKKVVISAPDGNDIPTIVFGVNETILNESYQIISAASCTTNCLAPLAKAMNEIARIHKGFMTTLHAYTSDQNLLDSPHPRGDLRRARAAPNNIVLTSINAANAIGLVYRI